MNETRIFLRDDLFRIRRPTKAPPVVNSAVLLKPATVMDKDTSKAYCADCGRDTPMEWLPPAERGRRCEEWFRCALCKGRRLTMRYD